MANFKAKVATEQDFTVRRKVEICYIKHEARITISLGPGCLSRIQCQKIGTWPYNKFIGLSLFIIIITSI